MVASTLSRIAKRQRYHWTMHNRSSPLATKLLVLPCCPLPLLQRAYSCLRLCHPDARRGFAFPLAAFFFQRDCASQLRTRRPRSRQHEVSSSRCVHLHTHESDRV